MMVVSGSVGGVLESAVMRTCKLPPEPEMTTAIFAGSRHVWAEREAQAGGLRIYK